MAVSVSCRIRPRVPKADAPGGQDALLCEAHAVQARTDVAGRASAVFTFDNVFDTNTTQSAVFDRVARPLVDAALGGINVTMAVYGQTGSGKTHTMMGRPDDIGISPRVVQAIFQRIEESPDTMEYTIKVSMLEIYMERVRDLLNLDRTNLAIRQDPMRGIFVDGAVEEYVASADELLQIIRIGDANRAVASTGMNDISSRSHSVVIITLEVRDTVSRGLQMSKLHLVDLAGSESVSRTGAEGITLDEARMINKSLFNLSKVINALASMSDGGSIGDNTPAAGDGASTVATLRRAPHVPYRDSKLTRLLQDSLGGNAKMALIVCCSPCTSNLTETLSTLRFGTRASQVKNKPVVNRVRSVEELERLLAKAEIAIDAQGAFIRALQQQVYELTSALGDDALERLNASPEEDDDPAQTDAFEVPVEPAAPGRPSFKAAAEPGSPALAPLGAEAQRAAAAANVASSGAAVHPSGSPASSKPPIAPAVQPSRASGGSVGVSSMSSGGFQVGLPLAASSPAQDKVGADGVPSFASPHSARDSIGARSRRGSRGSLAEPSMSIAQLMELSALREEVVQLRRAQAAAEEELASREEEVRSLTQLLTSKESAYVQLEIERDNAAHAAHEAGAGAALSDLLEAVRAFTCTQCRGQPFAELKDVLGVCTVHEHTCFASHEATAAQKRVEERAAVLQAEVNDLKMFISANRLHESKPAAAATPTEPPSTPTRASSVGSSMPSTPTALDRASSDAARDVVDVSVMQNLQGKLTALIHVHRQLLRKYAVVDVECGELNEALKGRDARISALTKAALSHNVAMDAMRNSYEAKIADMMREHQQQLLALRRELLSLRPQQPRRGSVTGGLTTEANADSTRSSGPSAQADTSSEEGWGGVATVRSRHVIKPVRGAHTHAVNVSAPGSTRFRGPSHDLQSLSPPRETDADDDDESSTEELDGESIIPQSTELQLPSARLNAMFVAAGGSSRNE